MGKAREAALPRCVLHPVDSKLDLVSADFWDQDRVPSLGARQSMC